MRALIARTKALLARGLRDESGADMVEYGVIVAIVALMAVAFLFGVKGGLGNVFGRTSNCLNAAGTAGSSPASC